MLVVFFLIGNFITYAVICSIAGAIVLAAYYYKYGWVPRSSPIEMGLMGIALLPVEYSPEVGFFRKKFYELTRERQKEGKIAVGWKEISKIALERHFRSYSFDDGHTNTYTQLYLIIYLKNKAYCAQLFDESGFRQALDHLGKAGILAKGRLD